MLFELSIPSQILFGTGKFRQTREIALSFGNRAILATNLPEEQASKIAGILADAGLTVFPFMILGEPTINLVSDGVELARKNKCDIVMSVGGGSAIDTGKAIAGLLTNAGNIYDYLEVVGKGMPLNAPSAPMIAIPTTAGTGAEVTRNAVLSVPEYQIKVSLRSRHLLPKVAIVDPELTYSLPPAITASTGLDALTQLIEPFVSSKANAFSDVICKDGIVRVARSLFGAYQNDDPKAREEMSLSSLFGGLALANAGLGAVHGFASVLGGMYAAPHGLICARLLPVVMRVNIRALQKRNPESQALYRYTEIAELLTGNRGAKAEDGIIWVEDLCDRMAVAPLAKYGLDRADFPKIIEKTLKASSTQANPVQLSDEELAETLESSI